MNDLCRPPEKIKALARRANRDCRIAYLFDKQDGKCHYCGFDMLLDAEYSDSKHFATTDHIVPKSKGGQRTIDNTVAACMKCNVLKGNLCYDEFKSLHKKSRLSFKQVRRISSRPVRPPHIGFGGDFIGEWPSGNKE